MSVNNNHQKVAYGLSDALLNVFPSPIISNRAPTTADKAPLGTVWDFKSSNAVYILTSIVNNLATWTSLSGGAGSFSSLTVNPGDLTVSTGNVNIATGTLTVAGGATITAGGETITAGNLAVTAGNITAAAGNIIATAGQSRAATLVATGDVAGAAAQTAITNVINTTQGAGTLTIKSATGNSGNNTGFIKIYVGGVANFVPYFANITP